MEWAPSGASCILIGQMAASLLAHGALESWRSQRLGVLLTPPTDPSQCIAPQPPAGAASGQEPARGLGFRIYLSPSFNLLPALEGGALWAQPQAWLLHSLHQLCLRSRSSRRGCGNSSERLPGALPWTGVGTGRPQLRPYPQPSSSHQSLRPDQAGGCPRPRFPPHQSRGLALLAAPPGASSCGGGTLFSRPWLLLGTPCPQRQALLSPLKPVGTCVPECSLAVVSGLRTRTQASLKVMGGPGTRTLAISPGPAWTC